jgi:hypothetical protein
MTGEVEQAIRRSHCSHNDAGKPTHKCVGVCEITATGINLTCSLCGSDSVPRFPARREAATRARRIIDATGISWCALSVESQAAAANEAARLVCPGCGQDWFLHAEASVSCPCGRTWTQYSGWSQPRAAESKAAHAW